MDKDLLISLKKCRLFYRLKDEEILNICKALPINEKEYLKGQVIVSQGEPVQNIGILKRGSAIGIKYHIDGNNQIIRIYGEGEIFLLDAVNTTLSTSPAALEGHADCAVIFLPYKALINDDSISAKTKEIIFSNCGEILSNELIRLMYKIDVLSKKTLRERILTYLSLMRERNGRDSFDIGMTQEQLAQYLCANRSVLSSELSLLRREGKVDYKGSRFIYKLK